MARKAAPKGASRTRKRKGSVAPKVAPTGNRLRPIKSLSKPYLKRLKSEAAKRGLTVGQLRKQGLTGVARGRHARPGRTESQTRRERERARVRAFAVEVQRRTDEDADDVAKAMWERIREHGFKAGFSDIERIVARLEQDYVAANYTAIIGSDGILRLQEDHEVPGQWFFYH